MLLTGIKMPPVMNGLELALQVHQRWPKVGPVVTSSCEQIADSGNFVPELFRPEDIVRAVQQVAYQA